MVYKKEYEIKGKIISKESICSIIDLIVNEHTNKKLYINICASFYDETTIEDNSIKIFENDYFDRLKLKKINVFISDESYSCKYYINISTEQYSNYISLSETNKTIFNSLCHSIKEIITFMPKEKILYKLNDIFIFSMALIIIGFMFPFIIFLLFHKIFNISNKNVLPLIIYSIMIIVNNVAIFVLRNNNPYNQFEFGQKSVNHVSKKNIGFWGLILYLITNIILPIIIGFIVNKIS